MMRHLLAKDVRLVAPYLWLIVPVHALYSIQAFLSPELYFWMNLGAALAWTGAVASIEWHLDADKFVASLPVTRAAIVTARYASALAGLAVGAVLFVVYGHVTMAAATSRVAERWHGSPAWASGDGISAFLGIGYVAVTLFLPFFFRFSLPLAAGLFAACTAVAGSIVALVAGAAGTVPAALAPGGLARALSWSAIVRAWLLSLSSSWGSWQAAGVVIAAAAALGAVSVRLSIRFYERREL
jgi:hypothetical protein